MTPGGHILVRLRAAEAGGLTLSYTAPGDVTTLLGKLAPRQVPEAVRRLYAICSRAQAHASRLAVGAALGHFPDEAELVAMEVGSLVEIAREHALRIALDWPRLLGEPPDHGAARAFIAMAQQAAHHELANLIRKHVTAIDPVAWLAIKGAADLALWSRAAETGAARFITRLFDAPALASHGTAAPGTLAARHCDHPLLADALAPGSLIASHCARLIDLCRVPQRIADLQRGITRPVQPEAIGAGQGLARVPCARGSLEHFARIEDGRIARYSIVSPTDRTFAPGGPAETQLGQLAGLRPAERKRLADLAMQALDPCVEYVIEVA